MIDPGIYHNIPPTDYFGLTEINGVLVRSNSMLHDFDRDPAEFHAGRQKSETASMRRGSLFDCLVTQQQRFHEEFVISPYDEFRTNESKEWRDAQFQTVIKRSEFHEAEKCVHAVHADPRWQEITAGNCAYQVGLRADIDGYPFKGLIDILPDENGPFGDSIVDIKRLGQMETMEDVLRTCRKFRYNDQLGLYRGLAQLNGLKRKRALLYIVPQSGPIAPCVIEMGPGMLNDGADRIMQIHRRLVECETTGIWPGRFDGIKQVECMDGESRWMEVLPELEEAS